MLSALTQPNFPKAALGIEKNNVTAVALQKEGRGQFGIKQAATIELPNHLLEPSFLEVNIHGANEMIELIEEAVTNAGLLRQKNWSVALPGNTARSVILTLDNEPASSQELAEILDWKAENSFGAPAGEMRVTRQKIKSDASGKPRYFATAVKLSVIDEYETIFERLNWQAGLVLPRAVGEANWLIDKNDSSDAMLISEQSDGFTALLLRDGEPTVVRSVTCAENEIDDEIYRLLMFYRDRLGENQSGNVLEKLLVVGKKFPFGKLKEIANEALGRTLNILRPEDVGLNIPVSNLNFDEIAAPAGLAALGWK